LHYKELKGYAVEPFPHNYVIAKENVKLNNLSKKINVVLAGFGIETCFADVSCRENSILNKLTDGTQVKVGSALAKNLKSEKCQAFQSNRSQM
jgi:hypothetical protein